MPYYALLSEINSGRHDSLSAETVMGLYRQVFEGRRVIDVVIVELREATGNEYWLCVSPNVSPHLFGELTHRPRVILRMLRKSRSSVRSEDEFCHRLHETDARIAALSMAKSKGLAHRSSFTAFLEHLGLGPDAGESDVRGADAGPDPSPRGRTCTCSRPILSNTRLKCRIHTCRCRVCIGDHSASNRRTTACPWVPLHAGHWKKAVRSEPPSYLAAAQSRGLPTQSTFRTPRRRNMAELVALEFQRNTKQGPSAVFESSAVYDSSQSIGYHALRTDGLIPTIATRADLVVLKWCRRLTPVQLLALMGFPMPLCQQACARFTQSELQRFVGNSVHPAVVGVCGFSLLCLMQPAPDQSDDDSLSGHSS